MSRFGGSNNFFGNNSSQTRTLSADELQAVELLATKNIDGNDYNRLIAMDQDVGTTSSPTFNVLTITSALNVNDSGFTIKNTADLTKQLNFDCSAIATGTARTITMPDSDVNLTHVPNQALETSSSPSFQALTLGTLDGLQLGVYKPSVANWLHMMSLNQDLTKLSQVQFSKIGINQVPSVQALEVNGNIMNNYCLIGNTRALNAGTSNITKLAQLSGNFTELIHNAYDFNGEWRSQCGGPATILRLFGGTSQNSGFQIELTNNPTSISAGSELLTIRALDINSVGDIGINQPAGTEKLEVNGNIKANMLNLTTAGGFTINSKTPSDAQWGYLTGLNQALSKTSIPEFTKLSIGSGHSGGYNALEVYGTTKATENIVIDKSFDGSPTGLQISVDFLAYGEFGVAGAANHYLTNSAVNDLCIRNLFGSSILLGISSGASTLHIQNGKVGINQNANIEALEVAGNVKALGFKLGASDNAFYGFDAGLNITTGNFNVFLGRASGRVATTGTHNVLLGDGSGFNLTTGSYNTCVGRNARPSVTDAQYALAIGYDVTAGNRQIVIGSGEYTSVYLRTLPSKNSTAGAAPVYADNSTGELFRYIP